MYLIGLTGGIAAGKSTVAKRWSELGAIEIDADLLARQVVEPGTVGFNAVVQEFGSSVVGEDGQINRKTLAEIVFNDPKSLKLLNGIVHPLVRELSERLISEAPEDGIVVYNVPLLVDAAVNHDFDLVVTVEAPEEEQIKRLVENRGMTVGEASARVHSQAKPVERAARADVILSSNQDIHLLLRDADMLWIEIQKRAALKSNG